MKLFGNNLKQRLIAVVRQQSVQGINCSIFLYRSSFGANQRLALTQKSFNCIGFTLCSSAGLAVGEFSAVMDFDNMDVVCTY